MISRIKSVLLKRINNYEEKIQTNKDYYPSQLEIWSFQIKFLKIKWNLVIFANLSILIQTLISARSPFVIIDIKKYLLENNNQMLIYHIFEYFAYQILRQILNFQESRKSVESFQENVQLIQQHVLEHIFKLDMQFFEQNKVVQLSQIISQGSNQLFAQIQYNKFLQDINIFILYGGQFYFIYSQSPQILFTMIIISFIFQIAQEFIAKKQLQQEQSSEFMNDYQRFAIHDLLNNIQVIKIFGTERKEINALNKVIEQNAKEFKKKNFLNQVQSLLQGTTSELLCIITVFQIFLMKTSYPEQSKTIASNLVEILGYSFCTIYLANKLVNFFKKNPESSQIQDNKQIGRLMKLFQEKPTIERDNQFNQQKQKNIEIHGNIKFENVSFKYPFATDLFAQKSQQLQQNIKKEYHLSQSVKDEKQQTENNNSIDQSQETINKDKSQINEHKIQEFEDKNINQIKEDNHNSNNKLLENKISINNSIDYVIKSISFDIKQGECIGFVGMSGSGKSTILKLIQRFYDVSEGNIIIDGHNIKDIPVKNLRESIGMVSQESSLFDNDILYNITYGCEDNKYTSQDLQSACDASGVSEFVFDKKRFPEGLKTLVGSKGMKLSGGQKQRVAIARALMIKPKILILDEATSSLDSESEMVVQQYIDKLMQQRGMSIIVIAHRLSTIVQCDKIFVIQLGEIKEIGSHQELIEKQGIYKTLISHQINFQSHNSINNDNNSIQQPTIK